MYNKRRMGNEYEGLAVEKLIQTGYEVIERNFYCKSGEIDIIARHDSYLVFIEVKYRKDDSHGYPTEAVGVTKKKRIINSARYYMYKKHIMFDTAVRFDVVSILDKDIEIIQNAFGIS